MRHSNENNKIEFIHNPDFVEWVLRPSVESDAYWKAYVNDNPSTIKDIEHARFLIKGIVHQQKSLTEAEVSALWDKIKQTESFGKRRFINLKKWSVAASILIILGVSGWLAIQNNTSTIKEFNYQSIAVVTAPGNDIKLILSDQSEKTFTAKEVDLKYNQKGQLETKAGKQVQTEDLSKSSEKEQMNQLVVPRGKRSSVELADGSKLWLNSGSRAIYPVAFNKKTREIFIEGEGYLEVAHDALRPFYVVTDQVKVKVLGTKFDISAYKDDNHVSVILVEGSVQASIGTENIVMEPNQLFNYVKLSKKSTLEKANVLEYISWKDGWMLCNKEQIQSITTKLSRYYDLKISYSDQRLNSLTLTGKLDLKSNCEDVLKVICTTAPLNYEIIGDTIYLTMK
ncbi:MAG TPA: FecR domain-containing protein [Prolixibacteraceae bacterium]|nr:FecR domain-containing protein [Prolixibacteraceae bacterium]